MEYKTVEGHPIVRDGEYEMTDRVRVKVVHIDRGCLTCLVWWVAESVIYDLEFYQPKDLMRPWRNQKSEGIAEDKTHGLQVELDTLVDQIFKSQDLDKLKELTRLNFPDKPEEEWIKWEGGDCPVDSETIVEVKFDTFTAGDSPAWFFKWDGTAHFTHYRIVKEPSPEVKVYKLSEMWKKWFRIANKNSMMISSFIFESKEEALAHNSAYLVLAITPADATEFYEGQNLESEARVGSSSI